MVHLILLPFVSGLTFTKRDLAERWNSHQRQGDDHKRTEYVTVLDFECPEIRFRNIQDFAKKWLWRKVSWYQNSSCRYNNKQPHNWNWFKVCIHQLYSQANACCVNISLVLPFIFTLKNCTLLTVNIFHVKGIPINPIEFDQRLCPSHYL